MIEAWRAHSESCWENNIIPLQNKKDKQTIKNKLSEDLNLEQTLCPKAEPRPLLTFLVLSCMLIADLRITRMSWSRRGMQTLCKTLEGEETLDSRDDFRKNLRFYSKLPASHSAVNMLIYVEKNTLSLGKCCTPTPITICTVQTGRNI